MKKRMKKNVKHWCLACFVACVCFSSCSDDDSKNSLPEHDPGKPVIINSFYPTTGSIAEEVIITGENFGTHKDSVKVYFNEKEASVVSVKSDKMLVLAPKLPGEQCKISVQVGQKEAVSSDVIFNYIITTNVSTIVGGSKDAKGMPDGTLALSEAQFETTPRGPICVDAYGNIFVAFDHKYIYMINENDDKIKRIDEFTGFLAEASGLSISLNNPDRIYLRYTNATYDELYYFDGKAEYTKISEKVKWKNDQRPGSGWFTIRTLTMNPDDGWFYFRTSEGYIARINPETYQGELLPATAEQPQGTIGGNSGETFGFVFDPANPKIAYFSVANRHCIYSYNLETHTYTIFAGVENNAGHFDGELNVAQFNEPHQMCVDAENNAIYIADKSNSCIRKIALDTKQVSTVAGLPGKAGYLNGSSDVAQFDHPVGITIDSEGVMYIADTENHAIRRFAIE
ncbi:IPT/TIG domain-containing protein [Parabacteroides pacaensis]|uniref:IPT/TIG domain-containing protein n=1 Tax=Parabacteroides pacaensis TaxID=2086575 RepID=UPI000D105B57|nr:IPT/TIG domain-containing protein [Parabacteroides pacaensis]